MANSKGARPRSELEGGFDQTAGLIGVVALPIDPEERRGHRDVVGYLELVEHFVSRSRLEVLATARTKEGATNFGAAVGHAEGIALDYSIVPLQSHLPGGVAAGGAVAVVVGSAYAGADRGDEAGLLGLPVGTEAQVVRSEVGAFYWTVLALDIVNPGREERFSIQL